MIKVSNILTHHKQHIQLCAAMLGIAVLSACGSGDDPVIDDGGSSDKEITFGNTLANEEAVTRAGGSEGLENYVQTFFVYGYKTKSDDGVQEVFPGYTVSYTANSANTTVSNTNDWEYVSAALNQTIKYWDYSAKNYNFSAVAGEPLPSDVSSIYNYDATNKKSTYTGISLTSTNLAAANALYFTQPCKLTSTDYGKAVTLQFTPYLCKVRIGFYENMDGFSVQNLTFGATKTTNLVATSSYTDAGTCCLTYDYANNKLTTSITPTATSTTRDFGEVQYSSKSSASAAANDLLGTSSDNASFTLGGGATNDYFITMLPHDTNDTPISITCSYEAVQSNGTITKIKNIPATVPAEYAQWKPGYEYSYIFKVSDSNITLVEINQVAIKSWDSKTDEVNHPVYNW